ncbi:MAG: CopG family ribbon-helix-helix protein [Rhodoferax sp.]|nr:CopG family ribbon-helix-helix protein [Rhodoferax sp.]
MALTAIAPMSLKLGSEVREGLRSLSTIKKRPAHALAREAVEAYVKTELAREQFTQDSDKAWQHYQETGLHANSEEVFAWIDSWGTSNELPKPKCHV